MAIANYRTIGLVLIGLCVAAVGCAENKQVYESTELFPTSIDLVDTRSKEVVWTMDVPVNHKLEVQMWHANDLQAKWQSPTEMSYTLSSTAKGIHFGGTKSGKVPLNVPVVIKVRYREAPEYEMPEVAAAEPPAFDEPEIVPMAGAAPAVVEEPGMVEESAVESEPAMMEATQEPVEESVEAVEDEPMMAEPESEAVVEEPQETVETEAVVEEPVDDSEQEAVEEPVESTDQPKAIKEEEDNQWQLPTIDGEKSKNGDYPALDE